MFFHSLHCGSNVRFFFDLNASPWKACLQINGLTSLFPLNSYATRSYACDYNLLWEKFGHNMPEEKPNKTRSRGTRRNSYCLLEVSMWEGWVVAVW